MFESVGEILKYNHSNEYYFKTDFHTRSYFEIFPSELRIFGCKVKVPKLIFSV